MQKAPWWAVKWEYFRRLHRWELCQHFSSKEACCTLDFNFGPFDKSILTSLFHPLWLNHQAGTMTETIQDPKWRHTDHLGNLAKFSTAQHWPINRQPLKCTWCLMEMGLCLESVWKIHLWMWEKGLLFFLHLKYVQLFYRDRWNRARAPLPRNK